MAFLVDLPSVVFRIRFLPATRMVIRVTRFSLFRGFHLWSEDFMNFEKAADLWIVNLDCGKIDMQSYYSGKWKDLAQQFRKNFRTSHWESLKDHRAPTKCAVDSQKKITERFGFDQRSKNHRTQWKYHVIFPSLFPLTTCPNLIITRNRCIIYLSIYLVKQHHIKVCLPPPLHYPRYSLRTPLCNRGALRSRNNSHCRSPRAPAGHRPVWSPWSSNCSTPRSRSRDPAARRRGFWSSVAPVWCQCPWC